jgi:hypothetical protein
MRIASRLFPITCALAILSGPRADAQEAPVEKPLPDVRTFLNDVQERLHSDELLLSQYTFLEKHVEKELDARGEVKKTTSELYEVYPSLEPGHSYRKLVARDGKRLDSSELEKEDRKHEAKLARLSAEEEAKRQARLAEARQKERRIVEELFRMDDVRMAGREKVDGRNAIVLTFTPRPEFKPDSRTSKLLKKFVGRAWIDEEDRQLVRLEAELVDNISLGLGLLAKLQKGATASFTRRKVNGEIWLPSEARFAGNARLLIFKALRIDATSEYSDYKKFSVGTSEVYTAPSEPER